MAWLRAARRLSQPEDFGAKFGDNPAAILRIVVDHLFGFSEQYADLIVGHCGLIHCTAQFMQSFIGLLGASGRCCSGHSQAAQDARTLSGRISGVDHGMHTMTSQTSASAGDMKVTGTPLMMPRNQLETLG
jgi:hypothetical protein